MANGMFAGGVGTEDNPYLIEDIEDLNAIRNNLGAYYRLISNINMNIYPYNEGAGWDPIDGFYGTLDGDGYIISNLYINRPDRDRVGLFGYTAMVVISSTLEYLFKNIVLENVNVTGRKYVAALVGSHMMYYFNANRKIENIFLSGDIKGKDIVSSLINYPQCGNYRNSQSITDIANNIVNNCNIYSDNNAYLISYEYANIYYSYYGNGSYVCTYSNCISLSTVTAAQSTICMDTYSKTKYYYLEDNLKQGQYIPNSTIKKLSQKEMYSKSYEMFSELIEAKTTSGYNFFEFNYGCPPTYNHKRHKSVLVEYDNKYHCYNHKNNKWVELNDSDPIYLANNSIEGLDIIPNTSWDEINCKNPKIVNIVPQVDKYVKNTDSLELAYSDVDSATLNSADKCIARTKITLDNNKFLEQIDI